MDRWVLLTVLTLVSVSRTSSTGGDQNQIVISVANQGLELGFPESWTGDSYRNVSCRVSDIPEWLDGYFVALVNGAYGRLADSPGSKLTHMFDGLAALASIQFKDGMVRFSGKYLPTRAFKIWDFHGRDMRQSQVAWSTSRSAHMPTAKAKWDHVAADYLAHNPNMNLWRIGGSRIVAVGEHPQIGLQFDAASLSDFQPTDVHDTNDLFTGRSSVKLVSMASHARAESDGTIYGTVGGVEPSTNRMYQFVFRISPSGVRTLEGAFEYGRYESSKCGSDLRYTGDKRVLAGLVKAVISTNRYVIIPITSAVVNPCKYRAKTRKYLQRHSFDKNLIASLFGNQSTTGESEIAQDFNSAVEFGADVPVRFLIFNKQKRQFVTNRPLDSFPPRFVSHPLNAYEEDENRIVIDMITYDNYESYDRSLYLDYILRDSTQHPIRTRPVRFTLDIQRGYIERTQLVPENVQAPMEYPAINPKYNGRRYRYAYVVQPPFTLGGQIGKLNVDEHSGARNLYFSHGPSSILSEPSFVPRPNALAEDDGVLLALGLEILSKRSVLYVIDAKTMKEIGRAEMPVIVPFGFHARYFDRSELIADTSAVQHPIPADLVSAQPGESIESIFSKIYPSLVNPWSPPKESVEKSQFEKPGQQTPIVLVQHTNSESGSKSSEIIPEPISTTTVSSTSTRTPSPFESWYHGSSSTSSTSPRNVPPTTSVSVVESSTAPFINLGTGSKGFYLSNGSLLELFPDGSAKSYPPIPNYVSPFHPLVLQPPSTSRPPYLGVDPSFVQFVKNQIPPPQTSYTVPVQIPWINPSPPTVIVTADMRTPSPPVTPYPKFVFPGLFATKPAVATSPKSIAENKTNIIVVDVIVDPNKRIRRPQPTNPIADDPAPLASTTSTTTEYRTSTRTMATSTTVSSTTEEEPETTPPITSTIMTTKRTKSTTIAVETTSSSGAREIESAAAAHDAIGRFLGRSRPFLCNFFGKAITALGSEFCKVEPNEQRRNMRSKKKII